MDRDKQIELYREFLLKCTRNPNSANNYSDFKRINECLTLLFPNRGDLSILDFDDPEEFNSVVERLNKLQQYIDYNQKGKNQYSNAVAFYQCYLNAKKLFIDAQKGKKANKGICSRALQQIFYGAPGTGKSHKIKDDADVKAADEKNLVFRTTFHPDSDYSTFVGCYKPTKAESKRLQRMNLSLEDLAKELGSYYTNEEFGKIGGIQKFCFEYYPYIDGEYMSVNVTKLLELAGIPKDYNVEINKYIKFCHLLPKQDPDKITYAFIPQAFTNAYVKAWNTNENVYLIIEEINRGNCAQIFGDLFQLLDRDDEGASEYPIMADKDITKYLNGNDEEGQPVLTNKDGIKDGKLRLPKNLHIWATMNTSDQTLFPIDSAFKRRWDWVYMPIADAKKNYVIEIDNDQYDWWSFLEAINAIIESTTHSEDKKLGYFFAKAKDGRISVETFVSKVIFYRGTMSSRTTRQTTKRSRTAMENCCLSESSSTTTERLTPTWSSNSYRIWRYFLLNIRMMARRRYPIPHPTHKPDEE